MSLLSSLKYHYQLPYRKNFNILVEEYKVIYFNTQKNANSTMKAQFVEVLGLTKTEKFPKDIHSKYKFPSATQLQIQNEYSDYLRFSILRNPWERLVSCYKNKIAQSSRTGPDYILKCSPDLRIGMSFEDFVEVICRIPDSKADYHFCSQSYLMFYSDGYFPLNYLCNIENLAFHIDEIKSLTNIPFSPLSRLNSSEKSAYEHFYTPDLIEKVRERYKTDITLFKYEFAKKNTAFSFGYLKDEQKESLINSTSAVQILKEKNRELLNTIENIDKQREPRIKNILRENLSLKKDLNAIRNSFSWRLLHPMRRLGSFILRKKTSLEKS